ncbi:MAG: phosphotransferase [Defluviitaleaceae bacterium]|nr:phosphotransferase [Defluviitaleaceae bacterium]
MDILKSFSEIKKIDVGMSQDEKYYAKCSEGKTFFLRIFDKKNYRKKEREFELMQKLTEVGVPVARPIKLEVCDQTDKAYMMTEWLEGQMLKDIFPKFSKGEAYTLGLEAGKILKKMHGLQAGTNEDPWHDKYQSQYEKLVKKVEKSTLTIEKFDLILDFFEKTKEQLKDRPQTFLHQDFGTHNMMFSEGTLSLFDFDNHSFGDPWKDFCYIIPVPDQKRSWKEGQGTSFFATGCIHGYFDISGEERPPQAFWDLHALYNLFQVISASLSQLKKSKEAAQHRIKSLEYFLYNYNDLQRTVPLWYENTVKAMRKHIVVSLTSYPERISNIHLTIETLMNQSKKADRLLLYLSKDQFPQLEKDLTPELLDQANRGLAIKWVDDDLKPHKKYYYAMQAFPDDLIITVDDDVLYDEKLIDVLYQSYLKFPHMVSATRAHLMTFNEVNGKKEVAPYKYWLKDYELIREQPSMKLIPIGIGGVLYPPGIMHEELLNAEAIKRTCLKADDLWLKMMQVMVNTPTVVTKEKLDVKENGVDKSTALWKENVLENLNDIQFNQILAEYDHFFGEEETLTTRIHRYKH